MEVEKLVGKFLEFAAIVGALKEGQKNINKELSNHLSSHKWDKLLHVVVIGIQLISLILIKMMLS